MAEPRRRPGTPHTEPQTSGAWVAYGTATGRWVLVAAALGSGVAFLDSTVVNVALPAIGRDLHTGLTGLQWTVDAYLLTLGSLLVLGGSLGDLYGRRRIFVYGLVAFAAASLLCGVAPTDTTLIVARAVQGVGGAMLVPGSLAIISATFRPEDRGRAIGAWSGLATIWTALGPFLGGWLVSAFSWRLVFLINLPVVAITAWIARTRVPETRGDEGGHPDWFGAIVISVGLGGMAYALIEGPGRGWSTVAIAAGVVGACALVAFPAVEHRQPDPMVPMRMFRSQQFSGANLTTFTVYGALGVTTFLAVIHLQNDLHYTPVQSGAAFVPVTVLLFLLSSRIGALAQRIGARGPMTVGPLVVAGGLLLLGRIAPGSRYLTDVLPGVLVLGIGLCITVAPLTAAVLGAVDERHAGVGSAINNAVARIASLLAVAVLPAVAGLSSSGTARDPNAFTDGYRHAMWISAALCAIGAAIAAITIRRTSSVEVRPRGDVGHACQQPNIRCAPQSSRPGGP